MKIRVLSYNIHKGFTLWGTPILGPLKLAIQETGADIVLLQEVVGGPTESQFEMLADSMWSHYSYGKNASFPDKHYGNAILSRFPIIQEENINISNNRLEKRGLLHCEVQLPEDKTLHLFNVHLDLLHNGRTKQLDHIIQRSQAHVDPKCPLILGGDFNDWPQQLSATLMQNLFLSEAFFTLYGQYALSFPSLWPKLCLDRLYFRHLTPLNARSYSGLPWSRLSDHLPILAEFEVG